MTDDTDEPEMVLDDESISFIAETTCCKCYAEFLDPEDLNIHISQVHANTISSKHCQFCMSTYTDYEDYALHIRDTHITDMKCCKFCTKIFVNSEKHRKHEKKHHSATKKYCCSQCPMFFDNLWKLENHEYKNHNNDEDGVMLQDCYSQLSSVFNIKALTVLKSLGNDTIYICTICDHCTVDIESYVQHLLMKNCRSLTCDRCSNVYKGKKGLIRHLKAHKECHICFKEEKITSCSKCHQEVVKTRIKEHEKDCKVLKCTKCIYLFNNMDELSEHHAKEHPLSVEVQVCKFCRREFVGTISMQKHIDRAHKDEFHLYKYKCVYCDAIFKHPRNLFSHFFIKHKDLEPYTCKICNTKFRLRKRFTLHIKLDHNSVGFVEFDEKYHVFFTDKKSQNPFNPTCVLPVEYGNEMLHPKIVKVVSEATGESTAKLMKTPKNANLDINLINVNSDFMSMTETEDNQTDLDTNKHKKNISKPKHKMKYNTKRKIPKKNTTDAVAIDSSDEEPLMYLKERVKKKKTSLPKAKGNLSRSKKISKRKMKFTCKKCNKYCYTFQNYHNHMSLHSKNDGKKCIKCSKIFRSNNDLQKHIKSEHAKSQLTETLKNLIEKRKSGINIINNKSNKALTMSEKFQTTIKKVKIDNFTAMAKITPIPNSGLSVQKFIENFTPDVAESKETKTDNCVTVKRFDNPYYRAPVIKLTKFKPENFTESSTNLAMPVKFKQTSDEKVKVSMKIVQQPIRTSVFMEQEQEESNVYEADYNDYYEDMDSSDQYKNDSIPEVAQEVLLEGTEETPKTKQIPHKIIIPKLTKGYKNVHIAHIIPTAPFFKIITIKDVLKNESELKQKQEKTDDVVKLPDGTKLVTANPLAHLLGDTDIKKVLQSNSNKYYKPRVKNFKGILAKALQEIDAKVYKKKPKKDNSVMPVEQ